MVVFFFWVAMEVGEDKGSDKSNGKRKKKKKKTNVIRIYSNRVNKHSYCSKCVYLHIYTPTDVVSFETKLCKFHNFFYFINTDMNALKVNKNTVIYTILHATQKKTMLYKYSKDPIKSNSKTDQTLSKMKLRYCLDRVYMSKF